MPLQPRVTGDDVVDQWSEEVTYELNNIVARASELAAAMNVEEEILPVYATSEDGNDQSLNLGSRNFVYYATVPAAEELALPLPEGTVFVQFRGEQSRTVEITIKEIPTSFVNARGETQDYTDFDTLVQDWSIGAVEIEDFEDDEDGADFGYRSMENKMLYARVRESSESTDPSSGYADAALSRSFDYTWTRNGDVFTPSIDNVNRDFPFIYLAAEDVVANAGRSSQFFCNVVQL